jgi:inosine-uridine nucleoside N-ribohydrolase
MNKKWKSLLYMIWVLFLLVGCTSNAETPTPEITSPPPSAPLPVESAFPDTLTSGKMPVIFSHGGGPCDVAALVYLTKHPNVDLIGMVLSFGEIHPEIAIDKWVVFLYEVLGYRSTSIGLGSLSPLDPHDHAFPEMWRGGADNFWNLPLPMRTTAYEAAVGHELIIDLVNNSPQKVTLLVMGAQTDIALAIQQDPGIIDNIAHIVIMGGAFTMPGNLYEGPDPTTNTAAEWNMYVDALAAKIVFNSGVRLSIVPLDAIQYLLQQKDIDAIELIDDPGVRYVYQHWQDNWAVHGAGFLIWDTITAVAVTNPEHYFWTYDGVDVVTESGDFHGQTIPLNNGATHTRYATDANYDAVMEQLFTIFWGETTPPEEEVLITELGGTWEGFTGDYTIIFYIQDECRLFEVCGTFEIPEFSLTGDITFVNINGNKYEFKATNISNGIPGNPYEYLEVLSDGTLKYFTRSESGNTSEAILHKK